MPIEILWKIPQRVLYVHYSGHMTVDDLRESIDQMRKHFEDGVPLIHVILDIGSVTGYPNLAELRHGLNYERSDKQGWTMFVGAEGIARFISSVLAQLAGNRFRMFETTDEAVAFLIEMDDTLQRQIAS